MALLPNTWSRDPFPGFSELRNKLNDAADSFIQQFSTKEYRLKEIVNELRKTSMKADVIQAAIDDFKLRVTVGAGLALGVVLVLLACLFSAGLSLAALSGACVAAGGAAFSGVLATAAVAAVGGAAAVGGDVPVGGVVAAGGLVAALGGVLAALGGVLAAAGGAAVVGAAAGCGVAPAGGPLVAVPVSGGAAAAASVGGAVAVLGGLLSALAGGGVVGAVAAVVISVGVVVVFGEGAAALGRGIVGGAVAAPGGVVAALGGVLAAAGGGLTVGGGTVAAAALGGIVAVLGGVLTALGGGGVVGAAAAADGGVRSKVNKMQSESGSAKEVEKLGKEFMGIVEPLKKTLEEMKVTCEKLERKAAEAQCENPLTNQVNGLKDVVYLSLPWLKKCLLTLGVTLAATPNRKLREAIIQSADQSQNIIAQLERTQTHLKKLF